MNYISIIGIAVICIGVGLLSDKKENKSKLTKILSIINIIVGIILIVLGFFS